MQWSKFEKINFEILVKCLKYKQKAAFSRISFSEKETDFFFF